MKSTSFPLRSRVGAVAFYHAVISETDVYVFSIRQITKINQALTSLSLYIHLAALNSHRKMRLCIQQLSARGSLSSVCSCSRSSTFSVCTMSPWGKRRRHGCVGDRRGLGQAPFFRDASCPPSVSASTSGQRQNKACLHSCWAR